MLPEYIWHVTLTTGHVRRSYRNQVSAQAVEVCAELIRAIDRANAAPARIPGVGEYYLSGRTNGGCLVATVWPGSPAPSLHERDVPAPLVTIGVARDAACGGTLWRWINTIGEVPAVTSADQPPPAPWVAAALDAGILHHTCAAEWLGDFERCLAWAWIENHSGDQR